MGETRQAKQYGAAISVGQEIVVYHLLHVAQPDGNTNNSYHSLTADTY